MPEVVVLVCLWAAVLLKFRGVSWVFEAPSVQIVRQITTRRMIKKVKGARVTFPEQELRHVSEGGQCARRNKAKKRDYLWLCRPAAPPLESPRPSRPPLASPLPPPLFQAVEVGGSGRAHSESPLGRVRGRSKSLRTWLGTCGEVDSGDMHGRARCLHHGILRRAPSPAVPPPLSMNSDGTAAVHSEESDVAHICVGPRLVWRRFCDWCQMELSVDGVPLVP